MNQATIEIQTAPGVWTPVKFRESSGVTITRGRSDEQSQAQPQRLGFTLDNRDGTYSPRNPLSSLFGKIGRNTPVRCSIDNGSFTRFYGEIPGIAPVWNERHSDNFIPVEAYGILRRLGQGQPVVSNALRDYTLNSSFLNSLAAYYPLSGGEETIYSQNIAPGMVGSFRGILDPVFTYGKDMPSWIGSGMELNATGTNPYMEGTVGMLGPGVALEFVWQSPALGVLIPQFTDYAGRTWGVFMNTSTNDGTLFVGVTNLDGTSTSFPVTGKIPALLDTELHHFRLQVNSTGLGNLDATHFVYIDGVQVTTGTLTDGAPSGARHTRFHYTRFVGQTVMNMAHVTVWVGATIFAIPPIADTAAAALGHVGETAVDRINRLAGDGGIPISTVGTAADSAIMGPQFSETRLESIRDCETTDMGILLEQRNATGLQYLAVGSLFNQAAQFTLDYSLAQVVAPLAPTDDDQLTRNDVTATRRDGGSVRVTADTGPLNTQDPPNGVGRYDTEITVNVETDDMLGAVAGWVLGFGTLDKARWPQVTVNLASPNISNTLRNAIKAADVGDRFVITNMRKAFIYDDVSLIIVGYTEVIRPETHVITFNCMPAEPYEVFVLDDTSSRISSGDTSLVNASMTTTTVSMSVLSADAVTLWTTSAGDMPISMMVAGEEMRVTTISGTTPGSAQTFAPTRSMNQVVKTHSAGEIVRQKREGVIAL